MAPRYQPKYATCTKKQMQVVYDLACEMSFANDYMNHDTSGDVGHGRRQDILDALNDFRRAFRLKGSKEEA